MTLLIEFIFGYLLRGTSVMVRYKLRDLVGLVNSFESRPGLCCF